MEISMYKTYLLMHALEKLLGKFFKDVRKKDGDSIICCAKEARASIVLNIE